MRDQRLIRRRHLVVPEPVRPDPGEPLPLVGGDDPLPAPADVERHQEMEVVVAVACEGQRRQTGLLHDDAEFLLQLPYQRLFGPFAGFDLAAWKLPEPGHRLTGRPLREKDAAVGVDKGASDDKNEFDGHWPNLDVRRLVVKSASIRSSKRVTSSA